MRRAPPLAALLPLAVACAGVLPFAEVAAPPPAPAAVPLGGGRPALTVVLAASVPRPAETRAAILRAIGKSFDVSFAEPPNVAPEPIDRGIVEQQLALVRKSYTAGDFGPCLTRAGEQTRILELLADGERTLGGRLLFWRVACRVGAGQPEEAQREAALFAALELELPADAGGAAPDVEALLADAARRVAGASRAALRVSVAPPAGASLPAHARVSVDGRAELCVAPCAIDVFPGDHALRVDADGFVPERRTVRAGPEGAAVEVALTAAEPALAARQWSARHGNSATIDGAPSLALLATALRARTLAVLGGEAAPHGERLVGVLAVDGAIAARSERLAGDDGGVPDTAPALLRDLLLRGQLLEPAPPLHRRPLFWLGIGVAAAVAAGITALLFYEPPVRARVTL